MMLPRPTMFRSEGGDRPSLSGRLDSWLFRRRFARHISQVENMPSYLLKDIGLPGLDGLESQARQVALLAAIRRP